MELQFIPARGRKRVGLICGACSINCNLSPRGDENFLPSRTSKCTQLIAIYPREGTKTGKTGRNLPRTAIAIYPREGTKTSDTRYSRSVMTNCNLSPRGDENLVDALMVLSLLYCNLSPRGDENFSVVALFRLNTHCNLSPRGDENIRVSRRSLGVASYCNLSPRGDEN